jgi:hypothetical protein
MKSSFFSRKSGNRITLFFYAGLDEGGQGLLEPTFSKGSKMSGISGSTLALGNFQIEFTATNSTQQRVKQIFYSAAERFVQKLRLLISCFLTVCVLYLSPCKRSK